VRPGLLLMSSCRRLVAWRIVEGSVPVREQDLRFNVVRVDS